MDVRKFCIYTKQPPTTNNPHLDPGACSFILRLREHLLLQQRIQIRKKPLAAFLRIRRRRKKFLRGIHIPLEHQFRLALLILLIIQDFGLVQALQFLQQTVRAPLRRRMVVHLNSSTWILQKFRHPTVIIITVYKPRIVLTLKMSHKVDILFFREGRELSGQLGLPIVPSQLRLCFQFRR